MTALEAAFAAVPRANFLPRGAVSRASDDGPIQIGHGQTNSQPSTVAAMLELLAVARGQRVLDVGSGSGWSTALLAHLTGPDGFVVGVEIEPTLMRFGSDNLARTRLTWASIRQAGPDVLGVPEEGPYDRILVSADATALPRALVEQLCDGGRLVLPVAGTMMLAVRREDEVETTTYGPYRFVPLRGK